MNNKLENILYKLEDSLRKVEFKGYDLFDALNSPFLHFMNFNNRILGIIYLQVLKRSPINLRKLLGVKKGINPKGFGLMLDGYIFKYKRTNNENDLKQAGFFADWLIDNYSKGYSGMCWGYNFDWPNRNMVFPKGTPTVVNTVYIANAFLSFYKLTNDKKYLDIAISAGDFILNDLNRTYKDDSFCFSYTPLDKTQIHNANMLGASLLASLYKYTKSDKYFTEAKASMMFSINAQQTDGSWLYGVEKKNSWIDSYHTGYSLLALKNYCNVFDNEYSSNIKIGFDFYINNFFTKNGEVTYFHNKLFPWDCHAFSHAIVTLNVLNYLNINNKNLIESVLKRGIQLFWDSPRSFFYYKVELYGKVKINYIRWVQMWMFYALQMHLFYRSLDE